MWWETIGIMEGEDGALALGGHLAADLASRFGTPLYVYNLDLVKARFETFALAMRNSPLPSPQVRYAVKANPHPDILQLVRSLGGGIDATSPAEASLALDIGFHSEDIVFTGTSLSNRDLEFLRSKNILTNFDSVSPLRRFAAKPGTAVGLRVNTGVGLGRVAATSTGGSESCGIPVKFGLAKPAFDEALGEISRRGYHLRCIHHHVGSDWFADSIGQYLEALDLLVGLCLEAQERLGYGIEILDLGGGYGVPHLAHEEPFPLGAFFRAVAAVLARHGFRPDAVLAEPGNFLVGEAGILVVEVNTVERKGDHVFVGVDAGLNVFNSPALYGIPHEILVCERCLEAPSSLVTIAGNICESVDLFARDIPLPIVHEGEHLAILNAGAYGHVMSSSYNLRPPADEVVIGIRPDRHRT